MTKYFLFFTLVLFGFVHSYRYIELLGLYNNFLFIPARGLQPETCDPMVDNCYKEYCNFGKNNTNLYGVMFSFEEFPKNITNYSTNFLYYGLKWENGNNYTIAKSKHISNWREAMIYLWKGQMVYSKNVIVGKC